MHDQQWRPTLCIPIAAASQSVAGAGDSDSDSCLNHALCHLHSARELAAAHACHFAYLHVQQHRSNIAREDVAAAERVLGV
jgi:hypothetical protein